MEIAVRRLSQGDESTLVDIVRHHKARAIGLEYATQLLANPLNFLLVAEQHQHPSVSFGATCFSLLIEISINYSSMRLTFQRTREGKGLELR